MIDGTEALVLSILFCGLAIGLFSSRQWWGRLIALALLAGVSAYTAYSFKIGSARTLYKRQCERYIQTIQSDPRNWGARERLAETLYNMGQLDRAIDEMQAAVDTGAGMEAQYKLSHWSKERHYRDTLNPVCRSCRTENVRGARQCSQCGADLPYESSFARWLSGGPRGGSRIYLLSLAAAGLTGVSVLVLPLRFAFIPVGCAVLGLVGWALLASARS